MAGLPRGYKSRAAAPVDLEAVAAVMVAGDVADAGEPYLDAGFLRAQWSRPHFDFASDAWVVAHPTGSIAGYAQSTHEDPGIVESWGVVHPGHRGLGIGGFLLDRIEGRAATQTTGSSGSRVRHSTTATDRAAAELVSARGFRPLRHFWHMQADLVEGTSAGDPPAGFRIGEIDRDRDVEAVHTVLTEAFESELWRRPQAALSDWLAEETTAPSYDPTLWFLAVEGDVPVGALVAADEEGRGWVSWLAVRETWRGRGIGAALLRASFAEFSRRRVQQVMVNVDSENPTGATAVYERVGMREVWAWDLWEKDSGL